MVLVCFMDNLGIDTTGMISRIMRVLFVLFSTIMLTSCEQGWLLLMTDNYDVSLNIEAETNSSFVLKKNNQDGEVVYSEYLYDGDLRQVTIDPGKYFIDVPNDKICTFDKFNCSIKFYSWETNCDCD